MIILKNKEEMKKYYVEETNTYVFNEDVEFLFDVEVDANIYACDIHVHGDIKAYDINVMDITANNINSDTIDASDIRAMDIDACDIKSWSIKARDISYFTVCYAYKDIECNSIKGAFSNSKHFVLKGKLIIKGDEK